MPAEHADRPRRHESDENTPAPTPTPRSVRGVMSVRALGRWVLFVVLAIGVLLVPGSWRAEKTRSDVTVPALLDGAGHRVHVRTERWLTSGRAIVTQTTIHAARRGTNDVPRVIRAVSGGRVELLDAEADRAVASFAAGDSSPLSVGDSGLVLDDRTLQPGRRIHADAWLAVAADDLLAGVVAGSLLAVVVGAGERQVRRRRIGRGLCPACAAPLTELGPEGCRSCGWGRGIVGSMDDEAEAADLGPDDLDRLAALRPDLEPEEVNLDPADLVDRTWLNDESHIGPSSSSSSG